ncbi:MAG: hypothetical protein SGI71_06335 [Verrucomicrobiota bacterium]|nr:hypothetical protein [Verrucomicrobiota bacterium]
MGIYNRDYMRQQDPNYIQLPGWTLPLLLILAVLAYLPFESSLSRSSFHSLAKETPSTTVPPKVNPMPAV